MNKTKYIIILLAFMFLWLPVASAKDARIIQNNFVGGELSPLMDARTDIDKYYSGCRSLQNCLVYPQGGAFKRPGTEYVAEVPDSTKTTRLIPFRYSDTDAYVIEFSDNLIRFYKTTNGTPGLVQTDGGSTYSIISPYSSSDLALLQYAQAGDVLYLTHPDYPPHRLIRTSNNNWSISEVEFIRGPFLRENDTDTTIKITAFSIDGVDIVADTFTISNDGDLSEYFAIGSTFTVHGSTANDGTWTVASVSYSSPDFVITTSEDITDATLDGKVWPNLSEGKVQLIASDPIFDSDHVGALWQITIPKDADIAYGSLNAVEDSTGAGNHTSTYGYVDVIHGQTITVTTAGTWTAIASLEKSIDSGTTWKSVHQTTSVNDNQISYSAVEDEDLARYRINCIEYTSGTIKYNMTAESYEVNGVVEIYTVASSVLAAGEIKSVIGAADVETKNWSEGAWSDYRGWPVALAFFEQRLFFGGNDYEPTTVWGSVSLPGGDYHNFEAGADDDDALVLTLAESQDPIKWLAAGKRLIVGTAGGPYALGASSSTAPLTPTNLIVDPQGAQGAASIQAIKTPLGYVYIERGLRKLDELTYNWERDQLVAVDLTRLASHITDSGIKELAFQLRPEPIIWDVRTDGKLAALTYLREENISAWTYQVTYGNFESVAVIPGSEEDEVWFVVNRTINGSTVRYVERMKEWDWGDDQEDEFFVDCGYTYDSTPTDTITGLDHLEGETVSILADGANHADKTVSGGSITLDRNASVVQVGLPYTAVIKPMKIPLGLLSTASYKRVAKIGLNFYKTGYAEYGSINSGADDDMLPVIFREADDTMDSPPPLFTGAKELDFPGGYEQEGTIMVQSDKPMPMCVLSMAALVEAE